MPDKLLLKSSPLTIRTLPQGTGLALAGEADLTCREALAAALAPLSAGGAREICLDLSGLSFIDLACTRELIRLAGLLHPGTRFVVRNPPWCLRRISVLLNPPVPLEFTGTAQTPAAHISASVPPSHFQPPRAIRDRGARRPHRGGGSPLPGTAQPEPLHRRLTAPAQGLARLVLRMQARDPQGGEPDGRPAALRHPVAALAVQHDLPGRGARPH